MRPSRVVELLALAMLPLLAHTLRVPHGMTRRSLLAAIGGGAASLAVPKASHAEDKLPPAAIILRVAEVTQFQEDILRQAASYSDEERISSGYNFGRQQMQMSVDILLRNTGLAELPGGAIPALTLGEIKQIAEQGQGYLSSKELLSMAGKYSRARDELRVAFEAMPAQAQSTGKSIVRRLTAQDNARKQEAMREAEAEAAAGREKLAKLEARQASMASEGAQKQLYAQ